MAIHVRCSNPDCGKMLSVRDDFAGKTGKCPTCGTMMPIPYPSGPVPASSISAEPLTPLLGEEDLPVQAKSRRGRDEDIDDYEYDEQPRRRRRDDGFGDRKASPAGTIACLCTGIGLLLLLNLVPIFPMYIISSPPQAIGRELTLPTISGMFQMTEGKIFLIVSCVVALFCIVALVLYFVTSERVSDVFLTVSSCLAGGWGIVALFWVLGFIWDIINTSSYIREMSEGRGPAIMPGIGLWIGLFVTIGTVVVFSILIGIRGKTAWLYLGEGGGLLVGILLLTLNVHPWDASNGVEAAQARKDPIEVMKTKFFNRYWPLSSDYKSPQQIENERKQQQDRIDKLMRDQRLQPAGGMRGPLPR
jgi:hypothetical protein